MDDPFQDFYSSVKRFQMPFGSNLNLLVFSGLLDHRFQHNTLKFLKLSTAQGGPRGSKGSCT
jgi:hypothetical protein